MEFIEAVKKRRSIRKFTPRVVPDEVIERALDAALLAPNSSNIQAWNFYWVQSPEKKKALVHYCLNQSAARTASHLVVVVADPKLWKRSQPEMVAFVEKVNAPSVVKLYYRKLIPVVYRWGFLNSLALFKWMTTTLTGFVRPITRGPNTLRDLQEVTIKSAALASENFVLSIADQGFATCMMEGHDEWRVKRLLHLGRSARVVMVIAVGEEAERGTWGPQMRIDRKLVIHRV